MRTLYFNVGEEHTLKMSENRILKKYLDIIGEK
jgi:hypothetical protein